MIRRVIQIDEEKCNGCGACAAACHEGAIAMIGGKAQLMRERKIRPMKKPDFDNIGKIVCDSLNDIAYHDDAQIVDAQVRKFFSDDPRVVVTIQEAE